jgi:hypothetical protein
MMLAKAAATVTNEAILIPSLANNIQVVGAAWVLSSTLFTTYSTTKFLKFVPRDNGEKGKSMLPIPRPALLTLLRFSGSLALGLFAHPNLHILERIRETLELAPAFAFPALFLFIANYANSISLNRIGISLTYTSKCAIPLFTLVLSILLDGVGSLPKPKVLLTLVPIAAGIATASWNHPTFEKLGFLAALTSCTAQSALNVTCKKLMSKKGVAGPLALRVMVALGLVISSVVSVWQLSSQKESGGVQNALPPAWLGLMAALSYHMEYALSFSFVKLVAPITYSACDAVRRLGIIVCGHYMFGGPEFTKMNILGIMMALGGAVSYSILNH